MVHSIDEEGINGDSVGQQILTGQQRLPVKDQLTLYTVREGSLLDELPGGSSLSVIMKTRFSPASLVPLSISSNIIDVASGSLRISEQKIASDQDIRDIQLHPLLCRRKGLAEHFRLRCRRIFVPVLLCILVLSGFGELDDLFHFLGIDRA